MRPRHRQATITTKTIEIVVLLNVVPTPPGGRITCSPDGRFIQARDAAGNPTGVRMDGSHNPRATQIRERKFRTRMFP